MSGNKLEAGSHAIDRLTEDQIPDADSHEGEQSHDLNEGEPELQFAEEFHGD